MTSQPPAGPPNSSPAAAEAIAVHPVGATAAGAAGAAGELPDLSLTPQQIARQAIVEVHRLLTQAEATLASGDDEQYASAYEQTASSADLVARALWYLRRAQREQEALRTS